MNSLLRRLVRPAGEIRPVRPTAALPYQNAPAFDDGALDAPATPVSSMAPASPVAAPLPATPSARSPASPSRPQTVTSPPGPAFPPIRHEHAARAPFIQEPPDAARPWTPPSPLMAERIEHPPTGTGVPPGTQAPSEDTPDAFPDAQAPVTDRTQSEQGPARAASRNAEIAPRPPQSSPSPLFAPKAREQAVTQPHRPQRPEVVRIDVGATSNEAPEIHVHIGRIEVTALPEAAAPQPKRRQGKSPMSLDDYLARKRGGAT